jgi:uncharacterized DUF497 family protein
VTKTSGDRIGEGILVALGMGSSKPAENLEKHGVSFEEAATIFRDTLSGYPSRSKSLSW